MGRGGRGGGTGNPGFEVAEGNPARELEIKGDGRVNSEGGDEHEITP